MDIVRGSVRAGEFSGLSVLSVGQKDAIINAWNSAKQLLPSVVSLGYPTQSLQAAARDLDSAIPSWRADMMSDDVFGAKLNTVLTSIGEIVDEDGNLVMDMGGPAADVINRFAQAMPNISGKLTVTGGDVTFKSKMNPVTLGLGALLIVGAVVWASRRNK
jgi:hypothetical protein